MKNGDTLLHTAAANNNTSEILLELIKNGANVNDKDNVSISISINLNQKCSFKCLLYVWLVWENGISLCSSAKSYMWNIVRAY